MKHTTTLAALVLPIALLAGCAALAPQGAEDTVRQRANEYWAARVKYDFPAAYAYTAPGYRALHAEQAFRTRQGGAVVYKSAQAVAVRCPEPTKCLVNMRLEAKPFMMRGFRDNIVTHVEETWLWQDGQWWLFLKP